MLYFGIDWSEDQHNLCIRNAAGAAISRVAFEHSLAGFERLEVERRKLNVPASDCPVAIETTYNLVVDFLLEHDYPVYIVPPQATEGYRNRQRSSGAHDDDSDAALLADILRTDRESHRRLRPNTALTQQILAQVRLIEILRRSIQRQSNQLRAVLRRTYAPAVGLFSDLTAPITLQFLSQYPTACEAQALSRQAFETFLRAHGYTRSDLIPLRYARLQEPAPAAQPAVVQAYRSQVQTLAHILLPQVRARAQVLAQLEQLFHQHPDAPLFDSLPGAGPLLAPALLAGCDKEFRRIAQQFALASLAQSGWASAYWQEIRPHCHSDSHASRILANRWLAIIWTLRVWQTRQPYDEAFHLQQRARRRTLKSSRV